MKNQVDESPIPSMVDVTFDDGLDVKPSADLQYGAATPGTMATTASTVDLSSPFGLFASFAASSQQALFVDHSEEKTFLEDESDPSTCLGITSPNYQEESDDDTVDSTRIGIERSDYVIPEGDMPLSPIEHFFKKKKKERKPIRKEYDSDDDDALWRLNLTQPEEPLNYDMSYPKELSAVPEDDVARVLHKQTSEGHYLMNSRPLDKPAIEDIQYSLKDGKKGMDRMMRRASDSRLTTQKTRPNIVRANSSPVSSDVTDGASFKVFLLLIQPQSKIFEIIQLFYSPSHTIVHDILDLIPANATEPALGMQTYSGLCRPKDGRPINLDAMASASDGTNDCARIVQGEILVAIPDRYSGPLCAKIAEPLLSNQKVTRLLNKSDPLAPTMKKKKKKRRSSRHYKSIAVDPVVRTPNLYEGSVGGKEDRLNDKESGLLRQVHSGGDGDDDEYTGSTFNAPSDAAHFAPRDMWQTTMSFRSDSSCSSVGSNNSVEMFSPPKSLSFARSSHLMGSEKHMSIPEHPSESSVTETKEEAQEEAPPSPTPVSEDTSPSAATAANVEFSTLEAKLQNKDVNGAIDAFSKMLTGLGGNDAVMQQLYAAMQQQQQQPEGATASTEP